MVWVMVVCVAWWCIRTGDPVDVGLEPGVEAGVEAENPPEMPDYLPEPIQFTATETVKTHVVWDVPSPRGP